MKCNRVLRFETEGFATPNHEFSIYFRAVNGYPRRAGRKDTIGEFQQFDEWNLPTDSE